MRDEDERECPSDELDARFDGGAAGILPEPLAPALPQQPAAQTPNDDPTQQEREMRKDRRLWPEERWRDRGYEQPACNPRIVPAIRGQAVDGYTTGLRPPVPASKESIRAGSDDGGGRGHLADWQGAQPRAAIDEAREHDVEPQHDAFDRIGRHVGQWRPNVRHRPNEPNRAEQHQ